MKKLVLVLLAGMLAVPGISTAQKKETRNVSEFTSVNFGVPGTVTVKQGSTHSVVLEGDPEVLAHVKTEVKGGRLNMVPEENWRSWKSRQVTAHITMKTVDGLGVSGSGTLTADGTIRTDDIDLWVSGSGDMNIQVEATGEMEARVSGSGKMTVRGSCAELEGSVGGSGDLSLNVGKAKDAEFEIAGSGNIRASGSADVAEINISGSGKLRGADFSTRVARVRITGSGDVEIAASEEIDAQITGSGTVLYKGDPARVNSHSTGSGKVRKL
jgi:hypothetical protein